MKNTLASAPQPKRNSNTTDLLDVIIIGTGFAGLGMATRLKRESKQSFLVLERAATVGGTWRENTYPGAACDVPSHLYSFSFRPNPEWSRMFAPGPEILAYLKKMAEDEHLLEHIRFNTPMTEAHWDPVAKSWLVRSNDLVFRSRFLVTGTGHLADWRLPAIPGIKDFSGEIFHSASWRHDVSLEGKRVGVVGTGASAVQIVPEVAKYASQLVVFQRTPSYVIPRKDLIYSEGQKGTFRRDQSSMAGFRESLFWLLESEFIKRLGDPHFVAEATDMAAKHLVSQVSDPALRAKLTPDYQFGCKRVLLSDTFYPTLSLPHVVLEDAALTSVNGATVGSASGNEYELDILIFATGFETTNPPYASLIHNGDGTTLAQQWSTGMQAFATTSVHNFPNLFILNGPNTSLGHNSMVYIIEAQIDYVAGALEFAESSHVDVLEITPEAEARFVTEVDAASAKTVWIEGGCQSWYVDPRSGRLTLTWPGDARSFRERNSTFVAEPYRLEERALDAVV